MNEKSREDMKPRMESVSAPSKMIIQKLKPAQTKMAPMTRKVSFDDWWMMTSHAKKLPKNLKESVKMHMAARGFLASGDFDKGLADFGIKA